MSVTGILAQTNVGVAVTLKLRKDMGLTVMVFTPPQPALSDTTVYVDGNTFVECVAELKVWLVKGNPGGAIKL